MGMNPWFGNPPAIWSFFCIIGSIVFSALVFLYLWFCYYPGGYKKAEVMDIGEYAMFVAQVKVEERKKQVEKTEEDDYVNQYDGLYHEMTPDISDEMTPRSETTSFRDDRTQSKADPSDWQSVGASEQYTDIEGSRDYYDATSSSSPGRSSRAGHTYDGASTVTPRSEAVTESVTPSQGPGTSRGDHSRDDRSEATSGWQSYY